MSVESEESPPALPSTTLSIPRGGLEVFLYELVIEAAIDEAKSFSHGYMLLLSA